MNKLKEQPINLILYQISKFCVLNKTHIARQEHTDYPTHGRLIHKIHACTPHLTGLSRSLFYDNLKEVEASFYKDEATNKILSISYFRFSSYGIHANDDEGYELFLNDLEHMDKERRERNKLKSSITTKTITKKAIHKL